MLMFSLAQLQVAESGQLYTHHIEKHWETLRNISLLHSWLRGIYKEYLQRKSPHCTYMHVCVFTLDLYLQDNNYQNKERNVCMCVPMYVSEKAHIHLGIRCFPGRGWGGESRICLLVPCPCCVPFFKPLYFLSTLGFSLPTQPLSSRILEPSPPTTALSISFPSVALWLLVYFLLSAVYLSCAYPGLTEAPRACFVTSRWLR